MKISHLGENCLEITFSPKRGENVNLLLNPFEGLKWDKIRPDILILTKPQEKRKQTERVPFFVEWPGEYEIKGVFIQGIEARKSTIYTIEAEEIKILYLGDFSQKELSSEQLEKLNSIDVLIIPVGKDFSPKKIQNIISQIEPKVVIGAESGEEKSSIKLEEFLKAMGAKEVEKRKKVVLKKKDLKEEGIEVFALSPKINK